MARRHIVFTFTKFKPRIRLALIYQPRRYMDGRALNILVTLTLNHIIECSVFSLS